MYNSPNENGFKIEGIKEMEETVQTSANTPRNGHPRCNPYLVTMLIVLILATFSAWLNYQTNKSFQDRNTQTSEIDTEKETTEIRVAREKLLNEVRNKTKMYLAKNGEIMKNFENKLSKAMNHEFRLAEESIPGAVKWLSGWWSCNKLVYKLANDKIRGKNSATEAIRIPLQPILEHCTRGTVEVEGLLQDLRAELQKNNVAYRTEMITLVEEPKYLAVDKATISELSEAVQRTQNDILSIATSTVFAEVGVGLEAVFIKSTVSFIRVALAKAVTKVVSTTAISTISAVADGPLPIGDLVGGVVAIGGLTWTAHDLYEARKVLPGKLTQSLQESVQKHRDQTKNSVDQRANELLKAYQEDGQKLEGEIAQKLQEN